LALLIARFGISICYALAIDLPKKKKTEKWKIEIHIVFGLWLEGLLISACQHWKLRA